MAGLIAAAAAAAAPLSSALVAGASVTGGISAAVNAAGGQYAVVCGVEIENYTKWPMLPAGSSMTYGYFNKPPTEIKPSMKEGFVCHKNAGTASGVFGTVSWIVGGNQRVIVMFSCPYNFDFHSNYMAVGLLQHTGNHNPEWTQEMYYNKQTYFTRGEYYYNTNPITYCGQSLKLVGTMGTSHKPEAKICVYPRRWEDLADEMKRLISKADYRN